MVEFQKKEAWSEYSICMLMILTRFVARSRTVGIRNWQGDDWFMMLSMVFVTGEYAMLQVIGQNEGSTVLTPENRPHLPPAVVAQVQLVSKALLAGFTIFFTGLWCLKISMLFFYSRLVLDRWQKVMLHANYYICGVTYVACILTTFLRCLPFRLQWQVYPEPGPNCTTLDAPQLVAGVGNIITDLVLLTIPIPLLLQTTLPLRRKLVIGILLSGGLFVVIATILRLYFILGSNGDPNTSAIWGSRETLVAVTVINAPHIKPLLTRRKPVSTNLSHNTPIGGTKESSMSKQYWRRKQSIRSDTYILQDTENGSQDDILPGQGGGKEVSEIRRDAPEMKRKKSGNNRKLEIRKDVSYGIDSMPASECQLDLEAGRGGSGTPCAF